MVRLYFESVVRNRNGIKSDCSKYKSDSLPSAKKGIASVLETEKPNSIPDMIKKDPRREHVKVKL